jgi:hypothetical protein
MGPGRVGISSGVGPISVYSSLGGGRRTGGRSGGSIGSYQRQLAAADKASQARELDEALTRILNLHREGFSPAQKPVAPAPTALDQEAIFRGYRKEAVSGIGLFKRSERATARQQAQVAADQELARLREAQRAEHLSAQAILDEQWSLLCANDPTLVLTTLEEAFEDNEAPAAAVGVVGDEVSLVVLVPNLDAIPERKPTTTPAGNLSLKKLTKAERSAFYTLLVCAYVLVTAREALAVAPGINGARVVVFRKSRIDAYGQARIECLLAAQFTRAAFEQVKWDTADAGTIVQDASSEIHVRFRGRSGDLLPLDLTDEPDLAEIVSAVDVAQLMEADESSRPRSG